MTKPKKPHDRHTAKWATDPRTGEPVPGVRYHSRAGYCIYIGSGRKRKRKGFGKTLKGLDLAKQAYATSLMTDEEKEWSDRPISSTEWKLERLIRDNPERAKEVLNPNALLKEMFSPDGERPPFSEQPDKKPGKGKCLRDCLIVWKEWIGEETTNSKATASKFRRFIRAAGNISVDDLNNQHFLAWQQWVRRQKKIKKWTVRTTRAYHADIAKVLDFASRKYEDWNFPDGLNKWCNGWKLDEDNKIPYVPDRKSKARLPAEEFRRCLKHVEDWSNTDLDGMPKKTQQDKGKRRQAKDKPRDALQWSLILRLLVQCSLDPVDIERMKFEHFKRLDSKLPYLDLPRPKMERKTGYPIPRSIPLLPSTVKAIKKWMEFSGMSTGVVFRSSKRMSYKSRSIQKRFAEIVKAADCDGWSCKHLRNVGATLGKKHKLSTDERDALLGHKTNGSHADYEDELEIGPEYLIPAVNLIGAEYLDDKIPTLARSEHSHP